MFRTDYLDGVRVILYPGELRSIEIGAFSSIASEVEFLLVTDHPYDLITTYPVHTNLIPSWTEGEKFLTKSKTQVNKSDGIIIGNDVWIGRGAKILTSARIGDGSVIGAYSVVAGTIDPYSIVIGNPSKLAKFRFDNEKIIQLLKLKWWDWDLDKIKLNGDFLYGKEFTFNKIKYFLNLVLFFI